MGADGDHRRAYSQNGTVDQNNPIVGVAAIVTIYVSTFIAIFFNVALAACAARSLRGEDTKVGEGISAAMRRIGPILGWTLVAGTVGLVLRVLEDRFPIAGRIAVWIAGCRVGDRDVLRDPRDRAGGHRTDCAR